VTTRTDWTVRLRQVAAYALCVGMVVFIFSRSLLLIAIYTAIVSWLIARFLERQPILPRTGVNVYLLMLSISLVASVVLGGYWYEGLRGLNKWIRGFFVLWMAYDLMQDEQVERKVIGAIVIAYLIATVDEISQYFTGRDFIRGHEAGEVNVLVRVTSSFGYFGMFAAYLLMTLPIVTLFCLRQESRRRQILFLIVLVSIGMLNLYLTRSRGSWLALFGMMFILMLFIRKPILVIGITVLALSSLFVLPENLLFHAKKSVGVDRTITHRFLLWQQSVNMIKARPIMGVGLNAYVLNIAKYNPDFEDRDVKNYYAHNGYLQHAAETGLVGFLAFISLLFRYLYLTAWPLFARAGPVFRIGPMLVLGVFGFLFMTLFDTIFHNLQPFLLFWFWMGWSLARRDRILGQL